MRRGERGEGRERGGMITSRAEPNGPQLAQKTKEKKTRT